MMPVPVATAVTVKLLDEPAAKVPTFHTPVELL